LEAVENINRSQTDFYLSKLEDTLQATADKPWVIAILGLTFKSNTDDQRESPAIKIVNRLLKHSNEIRILDPTVKSIGQTPWPDESRVRVFTNIDQALANAHAAILCTEWDIFATIDWKAAARLMLTPLLLDGRNLYNPQTMREAGIHYLALGRGQ
jgi:UDPglucose 6-dehydrogenase